MCGNVKSTSGSSSGIVRIRPFYEVWFLKSRILGNFDYLAVSVHLPREAGNKTDRKEDGEGVSEEVSRIPAIPTLWSDPEAVDSRNGQGDGTE